MDEETGLSVNLLKSAASRHMLDTADRLIDTERSAMKSIYIISNKCGSESEPSQIRRSLYRFASHPGENHKLALVETAWV